MRAAPAVPCAKWKKETHTSIQVQRRQSDIPCAMVLRLIACSPRRSGFVCHRRPADDGWPDARLGRLRLLRDLTPTLRRQDHTTSPYAATRLRQEASPGMARIRQEASPGMAPFVSAPLIAHGSQKSALPPRVTPDAAASTASRPASLTIRIRPSVGQDGEGYAGDLGQTSRKISENQKTCN